MASPKILVAYYSETGHTRAAAEGVAAALAADMMEIVADDFRWPGVLGFLQRGWRALRHQGAAIRPATRSPIDYDLLIIGSPVWVGHVSPPVRSYMESIRAWKGPIAFFVTFDGQGGRPTLADMAELAGRQPIARMSVSAKDRHDGDDHEKIANFVATIRSTMEQPPV